MDFATGLPPKVQRVSAALMAAALVSSLCKQVAVNRKRIARPRRTGQSLKHRENRDDLSRAISFQKWLESITCWSEIILGSPEARAVRLFDGGGPSGRARATTRCAKMFTRPSWPLQASEGNGRRPPRASTQDHTQ